MKGRCRHRPTHGRPKFAAISAAALCAGFLLFSPPASAQTEPPLVLAQSQSDPFSALVGKRRKRTAERSARGKVERYVLAGDERAFLFEDRSSEARVRFLCTPADPRVGCVIDPQGPSPEIYILTATRGPRGDVIYKNSQGDALLRIASYGGATVFWPGETQGLAASKSFGDDPALVLEFEERETAIRRAQSATAILSAVTGAPIIFDIGAAPNAEGANAAVLADAVVVTAKAVKDVADDPTGARVIASRITRATFIRDTEPGVQLNETALEIRYTPAQDISGRPSSAEIVRFLEESL